MDAPEIEKFLVKLGCSQVKWGRTWINASCPLARWQHRGSSDDHPSFGISIVPGGTSSARCLAGNCGFKGSLNSLLYKLKEHGANVDYIELAQMVQRGNAPSVAEFTKRLDRATYDRTPVQLGGGVTMASGGPLFAMAPMELKVLPESDLIPLQDLSVEALSYLKETRGLTDETIDKWEIGWSKRARRVALPMRDIDGKLIGISGRAIDKDAQPKFLHSTGFRKDFLMYGENHVVRGRTGYIVEGHFAAIRMRQAGYNSAAIMGSSISKYQVEKAIAFFSDVVFCPDGDEAGAAIARRVEQALSPRMKFRIAGSVADKDPADFEPEELLELYGPPNLS